MVYFIRAGRCGPVKIGTTDYVPGRLAELQTAHPESLRVLGVVEGGHAKERELHCRFQHLRIRGEWFAATPELIRYMRRLMTEERKRSRAVPALDVIAVLRPIEDL